MTQDVADRFSGPLTYAANWDEVSQVQFWESLDLIGVDAYYPLAGEGEVPTEESLAAAWQPNVDSLKGLSEQWGRPVLITEVGYPTQATAAFNPFEVTEGEPADQAAQALAYQAVVRGVRRPGLGRRDHVVELARRYGRPGGAGHRLHAGRQGFGAGDRRGPGLIGRTSGGRAPARHPSPGPVPLKSGDPPSATDRPRHPCVAEGLAHPASLTVSSGPHRRPPMETRFSHNTGGRGRSRVVAVAVLAAVAVCLPVLISGPAEALTPQQRYDKAQQKLDRIAGSVDELKGQVAADNRRVDQLLGQLAGLRTTAADAHLQT